MKLMKKTAIAAVVALSASCCTNWVSCSACKANFHMKSSLLCNLFFFRICYWHDFTSKLLRINYFFSIFPASNMGTSTGLFATGMLAFENISILDSADP